MKILHNFAKSNANLYTLNKHANDLQKAISKGIKLTDLVFKTKNSYLKSRETVRLKYCIIRY
jgi:hypothetical protein